jgi:hypothetical protein
MLCGADREGMAAVVEEAEFADHIEMQAYAKRNGLDYVWSGTALFAKRTRTPPPDQFEVRAVRTRRGVTMVGLFSAAITRAEREADAPYREAMAAKRLARIARARGVGRVDGAPENSPRSLLVQGLGAAPRTTETKRGSRRSGKEKCLPASSPEAAPLMRKSGMEPPH